jgi:hypothetical protein
MAIRPAIIRAFVCFTLHLVGFVSGLLLSLSGGGVHLPAGLAGLQRHTDRLDLLAGLVSLAGDQQQGGSQEAEAGDQPRP